MVVAAAGKAPDREALRSKSATLTYGALECEMRRVSAGFLALGLKAHDRIAVYLEKRVETVVSFYAATFAGGAFVPVNPLLRPPQVQHILNDCDVRILVTSAARLNLLKDIILDCPALEAIILVDEIADPVEIESAPRVILWCDLDGNGSNTPHRVIDTDMAAIIYTSGSTGLPKGVVLSHRNLVAGAKSVSQYLENTADDVILALLPLSFDAGLSQVTTAFYSRATVVLMDYLLPRDVARAVEREGVTGLAGVPPLWHHLAGLDWPDAARQGLRYFTNTGGHMSEPLLKKLRALFPDAAPYLMYGLTEAFRSTYLPPAEIDRRPGSIGKAIPGAEILVVKDDGSLCGPGEEGELVHRGALVAMGYWGDPERTAERFRPAPARDPHLTLPDIAVWSGDRVRIDDEGFLYFVGRRDEMIKTSGYRVSPTEIEELALKTGLVDEVAVIGIPDPALGQKIVMIVTEKRAAALEADALMSACRGALPLYMVPADIIVRTELPRNPNGKIDRNRLQADYERKNEKVES